MYKTIIVTPEKREMVEKVTPAVTGHVEVGPGYLEVWDTRQYHYGDWSRRYPHGPWVDNRSGRSEPGGKELRLHSASGTGPSRPFLAELYVPEGVKVTDAIASLNALVKAVQ